MNFSIYKPTELELRINYHYQENGLIYAADMNLERIAAIFNIEIKYYEGPNFAHWKEEEYSFIFINAFLCEQQRREVFFHELSHPLMHYGDQGSMHDLFKELQEIQAGHFQLYASMPIYMVQEFAGLPSSQLEKVLSEEFCLPLTLVKTRIEQIDNRIRRAQMDRRFLAATRNRKRPVSQDPEVNRIMQQLYHQVDARRANIKEA
jgi:hypothetical protein